MLRVEEPMEKEVSVMNFHYIPNETAFWEAVNPNRTMTWASPNDQTETAS